MADCAAGARAQNLILRLSDTQTTPFQPSSVRTPRCVTSAAGVSRTRTTSFLARGALPCLSNSNPELYRRACSSTKHKTTQSNSQQLAPLQTKVKVCRCTLTECQPSHQAAPRVYKASTLPAAKDLSRTPARCVQIRRRDGKT